ncbi:MAG TPA: DUF126 domain-containing protein [Actinomycetota bacterium]
MAEGRALASGMAEGVLLVLREPLSFWGGMDPVTGEVVDAHHPQRGEVLSGRVVAMPSGRGSSSASSVLAEAIRTGTAPAALVLGEPDPIVALGSVVASELYGSACPVVVLDDAAYDLLRTGDRLRVTADEHGARVDMLA